MLQTRPGGYGAVPESGQLDVREFDDLVAAGRVREALDLWQGEALADINAGYAAGARALLDARRPTAVERLMESQLEAGRHAAVVDELAGHVAADPLRERLAGRVVANLLRECLAGQLVLVLHRSGRQADARTAARA